MINAAIIGCGEYGKLHAAALNSLDNVQLHAFCDQHFTSAAQLMENHGGTYATEDPFKVIADPSVHVVYICTHHNSHEKLAVAAANAGKHIFLEKPLALSWESCLRIQDAVAQNGVYCMPGFKYRHSRLWQSIRTFIPRPAIITGQIFDARWPDSFWAQDPVKGGGSLLSQGCHITDILNYLANSPPSKVWCLADRHTHPKHPNPDHIITGIEFENGVLGSWIQGDSQYTPHTGKFFVQVVGESRSVQVRNGLREAFFCDDKSSWSETCNDDLILAENREFILALANQRPSSVTLQDGLDAMRTIFMALKSSHQNRPILSSDIYP